MKISRSPIEPGEILAGKYRIDGEIGAGSMGVVVQAWHMGLEQPVAIKFLYPEFARNKGGTERFRREARAAAKIRSEHVVQVLDVGNYGESATPYIVMEHLEGRDLAAELKASGLVPWQEAVRYILEACEAIGEAHAQGIVHRDLKPANLFLHRRGNHPPTVKVLDFGISKTASLSNTQLSLTDTSTLMGSPAYMSPEQLESSRDVDGRADIWSLGVILHEMILGEIPFKGTSVPQLVRSILAGKRTSVAERDKTLAPLEEVVAKCLAQRPDRRFADVGKLCRALRRCAKLPDTRRSKRKSGFLFRATAGLNRTPSKTPVARPGPASAQALQAASLRHPDATERNPRAAGSTPTPNARASARSQSIARPSAAAEGPVHSIPEPFAPVSSERTTLSSGLAPATEQSAQDCHLAPREGLGATAEAMGGSLLALPAASATDHATVALPASGAAGSSAAAWGHTHNQRSSAWSRRGALGLALATLGGSIAYEYYSQLDVESPSRQASALRGARKGEIPRATRPPPKHTGTSPADAHAELSSLTAALEPSTSSPEPKISLVLEPEPSAVDEGNPSESPRQPSLPSPGPQPDQATAREKQPPPAPPVAPQPEAREAVSAQSVPPAASPRESPVPPPAEELPPAATAPQAEKTDPTPPRPAPKAESPSDPAPQAARPLSDFGGRK